MRKREEEKMYLSNLLLVDITKGNLVMRRKTFPLHSFFVFFKGKMIKKVYKGGTQNGNNYRNTQVSL